MDKPILVDTNIYIALLRQNRDPAAAFYEHYDSDHLVTCGMIRLEVLRGIRNDRMRDRLGRFMDTMHYVPTTPPFGKKPPCSSDALIAKATSYPTPTRSSPPVPFVAMPQS